MSDCTQGGRRAYNAPTHTPAEDRLEITVHFHGEFNPHPIVLNRLDREVDYVEVDGERYERVRECENKMPSNKWGYFRCSECDAVLEYVPHYCQKCGAKVKVGE